jgi:outer membrane protein
VKARIRRLARAFGAGAVLVAASAAALAEDLVEVFELALTSDPEFLASGAAHRAAQEVLPQALAELQPRVRATFDTKWNERQRSGDYRSESLTLSIDHPVYRRDRSIAVDQADSRIARADALYAAARQDLLVRVAERYFGVLEAEDELGFAQATLEAFEQQLAQSRQRFEVGLIAITDVEEAKAGFDLSRAQLIAAENALDIAREALRETTGEYHPALAPLGNMQLVMPEPADIDKWTRISLERNLRLLAARHDTNTARKEIDRIQAGHSPTIDAVGSLGFNDSESGAFGETRRANVGVRLNLPIYSGGSILSRTRESEHRYQRALEALEHERRRTQRETRDAYLGIDSGISRVQALEQAVRSSRTAAEAIEAGFQVGTRTSVDVLDAQRDLFRARRDLSEARYRYVLDVLRLKRAAGVLSEEDLQIVSIWLG